MQRGEPLPVGRRGRRGAGVEGLCLQKESPGQKRQHPLVPTRRKHQKYNRKVDAMMFTAHYQSPLGEILLAADEVGLTGLWFDRAKYYAAGLASQSTERETPPLTEAKRWLDVYFSGKMPDFMPPLHPIGSDFRQEVWALLLQIPYGQTTTYGALAARLAAKHGTARLSAQAVGGAVGT